MPTTVNSILSITGPTLSSNVVQRLVSQGVDPATARKQISRTQGIRRLRAFNFPNREAFISLSEHVGSQLYKENLAAALVASGSAYGRLIKALQARAGTSPVSYLPIISGQPTKPTKKQIPHQSIVEKLETYELTSRSYIDSVEHYALWDADAINARRRATMIVEDITLSVMRSWLAKVGWTSMHAPTVRGIDSSQPQLGQFAWDLTGPSYLQAIRGMENGELIHGFVAADILLDRTVSLADLSPFLNKWSSLFFQNRRNRFQPMFIAEGFTPDALELLRERGCFVAIPEVLFGKEAARKLSDLISTIENAARAVSENPDAVFKLLARIAKIEGAALNARGIIIELMMAHYYKWSGHAIEFRFIAKTDAGERAEIDIKASRGDEFVCCECKGYGPNRLANKSDLEEWIDISLPRIKNWIKRNPTLPQSKRFEFYVSTDYTREARDYADSITASHQNQPVHFYNGADVLTRLGEMAQPEVSNMFIEQFGHPRVANHRLPDAINSRSPSRSLHVGDKLS